MDDLLKIQNEISQLQKQADNLIAQRKVEVTESIKSQMKLYGITAKDLGLVEKSSARMGTSVPIKYKMQEHTWTGRGRQPKWVEEYLAAGGNLEDVLVK